MPDDMIQMGLIGRAHGIKGELYLDWYADAPLVKDKPVYLKKDGIYTPFTVLTDRMHKGRHLITFAGITDRGEAEQLKGQAVFVPKKCLPPVSPDEAYLHDLIGCVVYLADGQNLGILDHVEFPASQQVWSIKSPAGAEILFPAQPCFIVSVDPHNHKIIIDPPAGLIDIYSA